jgi:Protein of unknown function (DUF3574)
MTPAMRMTGLVAVAAASLTAAAWATYASLDARSAFQRVGCTGSSRAMGRLELLFGMSHANGAAISEDDWTAFLDAEVTPRFPDGLTVLQGRGQWRSSNGQLIRERSNVLVIWHDPGSRTNADIEAIRSAYKKRFEQESVMRVEGMSCVSF